MAWYSLYVLKLPLNTKQTNKHYVTIINNSLLLCLSGYMHVCVCMCVCLCVCVCLCMHVSVCLVLSVSPRPSRATKQYWKLISMVSHTTALNSMFDCLSKLAVDMHVCHVGMQLCACDCVCMCMCVLSVVKVQILDVVTAELLICELIGHLVTCRCPEPMRYATLVSFCVVKRKGSVTKFCSRWGIVLKLGHVSEMTYTVSSGTLNSTIPYHTY